MNEFSDQWLTCREPVDHVARSNEIASAMIHYFMNDGVLAIADIGAGTGSTVRYLSTYLNANCVWNLFDSNSELLDVAGSVLTDMNINLIKTDLSTDLAPVLSCKPDIVTTSAFLDLVSEDWLAGFVEFITHNKLPFYAALTYDGRAVCYPPHKDDALILDAFNKHQQTNKGFGKALGPLGADKAISLFKESGYSVCSAQSDWVAGKGHETFLVMLLEGWVEAASEIEPDKAGIFEKWLEIRKRQIDEKILVVEVGHKDFFAIPK